jgi:hypothetical protein
LENGDDDDFGVGIDENVKEDGVVDVGIVENVAQAGVVDNEVDVDENIDDVKVDDVEDEPKYQFLFFICRPIGQAKWS